MLRAVMVSVAAVGVVLGSVIDARAGLLDFIWDSSGPQFIGKVFRCRAAIKGQPNCDPLFGRAATAPEAPFWLSMESGIYLSLWKDSETDGGTPVPFRFGRTVMFAFDPIAEFQSVRGSNWRLYHGIGGTSQVMVSGDFPKVGNLGYKVRLAGVEWGNGASVAFNLRFFPDEFGPDQFGVGAPPVGDRPSELTWGVTVALPYPF
jgi:hypothetical protein